MNHFIKAAVAASAMLVASQAHATQYIIANGSDTSKPFYIDTTTTTATVINAVIKGINPAAGNFTDTFEFKLPWEAILGTGSVTSSNASSLTFKIDTATFGALSGTLAVYLDDAKTTLDTSFNGTGYVTGAVSTIPGTAGISFGVSGINIPANQWVVVTVNGVSNGGGYSGVLQATQTPAVPEPATWAMLLVGFGAIGYTMRRRASKAVQVSFG